ncbi:cytochrome c oxidase subunit 4 [Glaciihabitans sp. INWT7]|uniref:cytochrome c oxidase subunit 4 n=1 Tax=Glaciihabitans sp. INWT7 TaxID=2596912 RepID=UPI00162A52A2|nr:cytochrome c oxidase subunit 4 [Glaciihabitans sp. INWT7]QNE46647.1 cytochrome c oxidase subunit 4 [Glaciihabitans sp. INWT7]
MNAQAKMLWILCAFFIAADITYVTWSIIQHNTGYVTQLGGTQGGGEGSPVEWVGAVAIGLAAILSAFVAFYLGRTNKSVGGLLPEDRLDANIDDGDPEQGFFSPWSWWPIMLAAGGALLFMGIAIGVWIAFIGAAITLISLVGWVYEYYRGNFAR